MQNQDGDTVLRRVAAHLPELGLDWELRREPFTPKRHDRPDALVTIRHPTGELRLAAEIKAGMQPHDLGLLLRRLRDQDPQGLLLADYINPKLATQLRKENVFFLDAAGNAYLRAAGLYIWVVGQRDTLRLEAERERRRAFQPSGLKLIFVLLGRPGAVDATYRELAQAAGVALGTVQWVMRDLMADRYVLRLGRFRRRLVEPEALFEAWVPAFVRDLRPRLLLGRFEAPTLDWWRQTDPREYGALWGGEPAVAHYTKFLKPQDLTIYAEEVPARLVAQHRLQRRDDGRIECRQKFWKFEDDQERRAVPPILVYADLLAVADTRAHEAADRLRRDYIDGLFEQHLADSAR